MRSQKRKARNGCSRLALQVEQRVVGDVVILDCTGRIVVRAETEFLFDAAVAAMCRNRRVLLNVSGVASIDSGGLGMLVLLDQFAEAALCDFKVCGLGGRMAELVELTNLHSVLDVYSRENEAIDSFRRVA